MPKACYSDAMKKILAILIVTAAWAGTAHASEIECSGIRYEMQDHDYITQYWDGKEEHTCVIQYNTKAFLQVKNFCDEDLCAFMGHVLRRNGNSYYIDRITRALPIEE